MNEPPLAPASGWKKLLRAGQWLLGGVLLAALLLGLADRIWPLPLPQDDLARVVLAQDGTPLWRFADANGVWRYPVTPDQVSPLYVEALLAYEDRWFYRHPGVNPLALLRASWQNLSGARVVSGGSTLSMQLARLLDPHSRTLPGICPKTTSLRFISIARPSVARCRALRPPAGRTWVNRPCN
jgi:penicillin-binding protein 1C